MVSEVNPVPVAKAGPVPAPTLGYFPGISITRHEPYLFGTCCEALGVDPADDTGWIFVVDGDGLTLIARGEQYSTLPWHMPSKGD